GSRPYKVRVMPRPGGPPREPGERTGRSGSASRRERGGRGDRERGRGGDRGRGGSGGRGGRSSEGGSRRGPDGGRSRPEGREPVRAGGGDAWRERGRSGGGAPQA